MVVVLMGVSGSGKTTVGKLLAAELGWTFVEADDFHSPANIDKLRRGIPLDDDDRTPWLQAIRGRIDEACRHNENLVLACSALKHAYQDYLEQHFPAQVSYVYLQGTEQLIHDRLATRQGHFMNPSLLHSQFEILEPPDNSVIVQVTATPKEIVSQIRLRLSL